MDKTWSIEDVKNGARTVKSITSCRSQSKAKQYGCIHAPLFPTISITHVIPDVLHIFSRITDVLFDLLIMDIQRQDGVDNGSRLGQLELFLNHDCHIPFKFSVCKEKNYNGVILWGLRSWSCLIKST